MAGGLRQVLGRLADHPDRAAGVGLAEHDPRGPGLDHGVDQIDDLVGPGGDVRRIDQAQPAALVAHPLDRRDRPPGPLGDRRIIEVGIKVFVFLDEHQERAAGHLADQPFDVVGRDAGRRLEDRAERRLVEGKARLLADVDRAVGRAGERAKHIVGDLERDQTGRPGSRTCRR